MKVVYKQIFNRDDPKDKMRNPNEPQNKQQTAKTYQKIYNLILHII